MDKQNRLKRIAILAVLAWAAITPLVWIATVAPVEGIGFPSDDAWIHQVFARNLARDGMLAYNPGERSVGVTAPLWTFIVSEVHFFHLPFREATLVLTIATFMLWAFAVFWLMEGVWREGSPWWPAAAAILACTFGPMVWYAASGLETCLFFGLITLACAAFGRGRHALAGMAAAAAVPTRPEGGFLVALLFGIWIYRLIKERRKPTPGEVVGYVAMPLLFITPFVVQNLIIAGVPFPSTYYGRHWLYLGASSHSGFWSWDGPLFLAFHWLRYINVWALGQNDLSNGAKIFTDPTTLAQLGLWVAIAAAFRRKLNAGWVLFGAWIFLHNLAYGFLLPNFGTAGRYEGANFAFFAMGIVFGARILREWIKTPGFKVVPFILLGAAFFSLTGSYMTWHMMYTDNIHHITTVHEAAGRWMARNLPKDARIAAFDIGVFGYYGERYIVDIGGLVDSECGEYLKNRRMNAYLEARKADYLQMMEIDTSEITPLATRMHLSREPWYNAVPVQSWELAMERRRFLSITAIAYPTLTIYKLEPKVVR